MSVAMSIELKPDAGTLHYFVATVGGELAISEFANKTRTWTGELVEGEVTIDVKVYGLAGGRYTLKVDLPGTDDDWFYSGVIRQGQKQDTFQKTLTL